MQLPLFTLPAPVIFFLCVLFDITKVQDYKPDQTAFTRC